MLLRFAETVMECADPARVMEAGSHACAWCGFAAMRGMRAYVDDDGRDMVACSVCHAARHAGMTDAHRDLFRIVWAPEVPQPFLSHLGRTIAYLRELHRLSPSAKDASGKVRPRKVKGVDPRVFADLKARGDALDRFFADGFDATPAACLPSLPDGVRADLHAGIRMLPVAFPRSEIDAWRNDESSFGGLGLAAIEDREWFVRSIGLNSVGIGTDHDDADRNIDAGDTHVA